LNQYLPGLVWRSSFIVGFPGETNADFDILYDFVEEQQISRGGVFLYSREEGTAAYDYGRRPPNKTVVRRREMLENLINLKAEEFNRSLIGNTAPMLVESWDKETSTAVGRLYCDAPEIDFEIHARARNDYSGRIKPVHVMDVTSAGFVGDIVDRGESC
jgi:ribosomal protein S12 methylthiotransferase